MLLLERRVAELEKDSNASGEVHARLRQENLQLVHRANALEEQLKEQELYAEECLEQEERRHKEALSKMEREMGLELENLQTRWEGGGVCIWWGCVYLCVHVGVWVHMWECARVAGAYVQCLICKVGGPGTQRGCGSGGSLWG